MRCRTVCAEQKNKAADGSLIRYLYLIGINPIKSGFFGFLGSFFPKKLPKWGMGRSPIKIVPHVGVRGAEMRKIVLPAGREASRKPLPAP